ncbi:MAG TPA: DoxX family protein [Acidimicrobiales bacterium]|nr:DoxX family protein [Acidimicrobiales bacterium]
MGNDVAGRTGGWGLTALRVGTGAVMAGHGLQKLRDLDRVGQVFDMIGLKPGRDHALLASITEIGAGVASVLGLWTPAASAATTGAMTVAIAKVHGKNGLWLTDRGYEYNATLIAIAFALAAAGPGHLAADGLVTRRRANLGWALGELALGVGTAVAVMALADRRSRQAAEPEETPA